jgi:hypothetical protein
MSSSLQLLSISIAVPLVAACQATPTDVTSAAVSVEQAAAPDTTIIPLDEVKPSQSGSVTQQIANTEITVTYDRPVARGRELFGGIVPYGEIWNPGANDATKITLSRDITINGDRLEAGAYSIWAIPGEREWTVIFSRAADVFHQPYPGEEHDALRQTVAPTAGDHVETLAFYFPVVEKKGAELRLHWGETIVPLAITVQ